MFIIIGITNTIYSVTSHQQIGTPHVKLTICIRHGIQRTQCWLYAGYRMQCGFHTAQALPLGSLSAWQRRYPH